MDVILHLGAHRTASTSFQHYMRENSARLARAGVGFWGPRKTRAGVLSGVAPDAANSAPGDRPGDQLTEAAERIAENLDRARDRGVRHLVISDENVIGAPRKNLRDGMLYHGVGERMARYSHAFGGRLTRLVLSVRSLEMYWSSVLAYAVTRGHAPLGPDALDALARHPRRWRDVITDIACAVPDVEFQVQPHEVFGALPEQRLAAMTGREGLPLGHAREWLHRGPALRHLRTVLADRGTGPEDLPEGDGRWQPFDRDQTLLLRQAYAEDLGWLRGGAEGLATLIDRNGPSVAPPDATHGPDDTAEPQTLAG